MKLFLVTGKVDFTPYMSRTRTTTETRLVWANDWDEASKKFEKHFHDQSVPNDDSYYARVEDVTEAIE